MTFNEYVKYRFDMAKSKNRDFSETGNSSVAVCNQSFWFIYKYSCNGLAKAIKRVANKNPINYQIGDIFILPLVTIFFPVIAIMRARITIVRAKKELMEEYLKKVKLDK